MRETILSKLPPKIRALLESRRFWAVVSAVVVVGFKDQLNEQLGMSLTEEQITRYVGLVAAWVIGDSISKTGE